MQHGRCKVSATTEDFWGPKDVVAREFPTFEPDRELVENYKTMILSKRTPIQEQG